MSDGNHCDKLLQGENSIAKGSYKCKWWTVHTATVQLQNCGLLHTCDTI